MASSSSRSGVVSAVRKASTSGLELWHPNHPVHMMIHVELPARPPTGRSPSRRLGRWACTLNALVARHAASVNPPDEADPRGEAAPGPSA